MESLYWNLWREASESLWEILYEEFYCPPCRVVAVTSIKVDGVLHELSTLPGVKEDLVEIILNLKDLALKMSSDEPKIITINAQGPGRVTAGDIIADADVEILNPEHHLQP